MAAIRRGVRRKLGETGVRDVLDICCGTGHQARLLGAAVDRVVGIDRSAAMIAVASRKTRGFPPFLRGDARNLPFGDGSFDAALLSFALHENDPSCWHPMIREALRILRPRGRLLVVDYLAPPLKRKGIASLMVNGVEWLAGERHHQSFNKFLEAGGVTTILGGHPLKIVSVEPIFAGTVGMVTSEKKVLAR